MGIAVVPHPPLLVPQLTARSSDELERLRSRCSRAVSSLADRASTWVAIGSDSRTSGVFGPELVGTFAAYGVDVVVRGGLRASGPARRDVPLAALVAAWLREQAGANRVTTHVLPEHTSPSRARELGAALRSEHAESTGLLILADGTACRDDRSPWPPDARATGFDEAIAEALAHADLAALRGLDAGLAQELGVRGFPALQALTGFAADGHWHGRFRTSETPFGVTYHCATWTRDSAAAAGDRGNDARSPGSD